MRKNPTDNIIEEIIAGGGEPDLRQRHVFRQTLYSLVRLAKAEQLSEMRVDVERAAGTGADSSRGRARSLLRKIGMSADFGPQPPASDRQNPVDADQASLPCPGPGCPDGPGNALPPG